MERVVDTAVVVSIASLAILVLQVRGLVAGAVLFGLAVTALLVLVLALLVVAHRLPGAERIAAFAERWPTIADVAGKLHGGLAVAGKPRTLVEALVLSFVAWGATVVAFAAAGQSLGVEMTTAQAALLAAGVALATAIPAGPGNLGTFDLAAVAIAGDVRDRSGDGARARAHRPRDDPRHDLDRWRVSRCSPSAGGSGGRQRRSTHRPGDAGGPPKAPAPRPAAPGTALAESSAPADAGARSGAEGDRRYLTKPFAWSQALATTAMSFLSTAICLPRSVRVAVSILAETSLRIFEKAALSTLAR